MPLGSNRYLSAGSARLVPAPSRLAEGAAPWPAGACSGCLGSGSRLSCLLAAAVLIGLVPERLTAQSEDPRLTEARWRMVQNEIVSAGIRDPRVVLAMRNTPRHHFVLPEHLPHAYFDMALPIGEGQTISPPFIVANMTQALHPEPEDKVLEIGTGSGYQAAVLSPLVAEVYSIEIVEPLGRRAGEVLQRLGYTNVHTRIGDGFQGWPEAAPFDKIIVTCSPENVPQALFEQLREGGTMVIPLGERYQQTLYRLTKRDGNLEQEVLEPTFFVPMTGRAEQLREVKDPSGRPELVNGSFEEVSEDGLPIGWYYIRQATVVEGPAAREGRRYLELRNETPGRGAQLLQALAMDGRRVREIELSLWVETRQVRAGRDASQLPRVDLYFFNDQRVPVGHATLGPWRGQQTWTQQRQRSKVPADARLGVMAVGMFGATGQVRVDRVTLQAFP